MALIFISSAALRRTKTRRAALRGCTGAVGADETILGAAGGLRATALRATLGAACYLGPRASRTERLISSERNEGGCESAAEQLHRLPPGHRRGEDTGNVIDEIVHVFGPKMRGMRRKRWPDHSTRPNLLAQP